LNANILMEIKCQKALLSHAVTLETLDEIIRLMSVMRIIKGLYSLSCFIDTLGSKRGPCDSLILD